MKKNVICLRCGFPFVFPTDSEWCPNCGSFNLGEVVFKPERDDYKVAYR